MKKKQEKESSKKKGKLSALKGLRDAMSSMMGEGIKGMKKVTVMAKDKSGLKKGLEKAEEMMGEDESDC